MNRFTAAFALLLSASLAAQAAEPPLRFVWQPGQIWFERVTQTWTRQVIGKGSKVPVEVKDTAETTLEIYVANVEKGIASLEVTMLRVKIKEPEEKLSWDSAKKEAKPGKFAEVAELVGKTAVVQLDARGVVVNRELPGKGRTTIRTGAWEWPWFASRPALPESAPRIGMTWNPQPAKDGRIVLTHKLVKFDSTTATIEESRKENERVFDDFVRIAVVKDVATWVLDLATGATQEEVRERIESIGPAVYPIHSHVTRRVRIPPPPERLRRNEPPAAKPK